MKRMKFLFGQRRMQVLLTLAVLLLAASVVIGSGANFTSTSANVGNVFTAGNLQHTSTTSTGASMTVSKLKPDDKWVTAGTVTVTNTGDIDGAFSMTGAITADTALLSNVLRLRVHKSSDSAGVYVYNDDVNAVTNVAMGTILGGGSAFETYTFQVMFPNGPTPSGADTGDNAYKGASMTIAFNWTAVNLIP